MSETSLLSKIISQLGKDKAETAIERAMVSNGIGRDEAIKIAAKEADEKALLDTVKAARATKEAESADYAKSTADKFGGLGEPDVSPSPPPAVLPPPAQPTDLSPPGLFDRIKDNKGKLAAAGALGAGALALTNKPPQEAPAAPAPEEKPSSLLGLVGNSDTAKVDVTPPSPTPTAPARPAYTPPPVKKVQAEEEQLSDHWDKRIDQVQKYAEGLPKEEHSDWQSKYDALTKEMDEAKSRNQTGQLIETIAQAVTQLAAGAYGLRTGLDMGGLKFSKADWDKRMDNILSEFKAKKEIVSEGHQLEDRGNARKFQAKQDAEKLVQDTLNDKAAAEERLNNSNANRSQEADKFNAGEENKRTTDLLNAQQQRERDDTIHQERMEQLEAANKVRLDIASGKLDTSSAKRLQTDLARQNLELAKDEEEVRGALGVINNPSAKPPELTKAYAAIAKHTPGTPADLEKALNDNLGGAGLIRTGSDDKRNYGVLADKALKNIQLSRKANEVKLNNIQQGIDQAPDGQGINKVSVTAPAAGKIRIQAPDGSVEEVNNNPAVIKKYTDRGGKVVP